MWAQNRAEPRAQAFLKKMAEPGAILHLPAREKNCWISWSMKPISKFFNRYITTAGNCNPRWRSLRLCFFDLSDYNSFQDTSLELFNYTTQHHNIWRKKWHVVSLCCQTCVVINNCLLSTLRQLKHVGLDDQNLVYRVKNLNIYCHLTLQQPIYYNRYLTSLWFPSICHNAFGPLTLYFFRGVKASHLEATPLSLTFSYSFFWH